MRPILRARSPPPKLKSTIKHKEAHAALRPTQTQISRYFATAATPGLPAMIQWFTWMRTRNSAKICWSSEILEIWVTRPHSNCSVGMCRRFRWLWGVNSNFFISGKAEEQEKVLLFTWEDEFMHFHFSILFLVGDEILGGQAIKRNPKSEHWNRWKLFFHSI